jgi:hypothetical protein
MALRNSSTRGRRPVHVEVTRADELPSASPALAVRPDRDASGRFVAGNAAGVAKRVRPGIRGALGLDNVDPRYRAFALFGARYGAHRCRELAQSHGGSISVGVRVMIDSAAQALAASRLVQVLAAESANADLFKRAADLACIARQHELAAWELAARENVARPMPPDAANVFLFREGDGE